MTNGYTVRDYRESDRASLLRCLEAALGTTPTLPMTESFWEWKHFDNPFGRSMVIVAVAGNDVIGVRAYLQWRFVDVDGATYRGLRAVDTATHPDHHRRGIFRRLTTAANERARAGGFDFVFNTPNEHSRPGYLSMGWRIVGKPLLWMRPLSVRGIVAGATASNDRTGWAPSGSCAVESGFAFDDRPSQGLRTDRSTDFFAWRYANHPTVPYRLVGTPDSGIFVRPSERYGRAELVVSEVWGDSIWSLRGSSAAYAVASARLASPEARSLVRRGFLPAPRIGMTLVANPLSSRAAHVDRIDAWDLSLGDLELM